MTVTEQPTSTEWVYNRPTEDDNATGHVLLTLRIYADDGQFAGECVELDVASCGDDLEEALRNTLEATALALERLDARGEREYALSTAGVKLYDIVPPDDFSIGLTAHPGEFVTAQRFSVRPRRA